MCLNICTTQWWRHQWKLQALQCVEASGKVQIVDFAGTPPIWMIVSGPYVSMMVTASCLHRCLRSELMVSMLNVHSQTKDALFDTRLDNVCSLVSDRKLWKVWNLLMSLKCTICTMEISENRRINKALAVAEAAEVCLLPIVSHCLYLGFWDMLG